MLDRTSAILVVIDLQEAFRRAIPQFDMQVANANRLLAGARLLGVPAVVTEQYPKGLGPTVPELDTGDLQVVAKRQFSAVGVEGFDLGSRDHAIVCGAEAHVCVYQTVMDLLDKGVGVDVCLDAIGSRHETDRQAAAKRMAACGAALTTVETVLFELCRTSADPEFKALQRLII
jgi:nicotinamidase-related amidase